MMINFIQIVDWSIVFYLCSLPPLILNSLLPSNSGDTKPKKSTIKVESQIEPIVCCVYTPTTAADSHRVLSPVP